MHINISSKLSLMPFWLSTLVVVDCNKVATVVVLCTSLFTQVILKMNRPTNKFTGVIFYWIICTFTQVLDLWDHNLFIIVTICI